MACSAFDNGFPHSRVDSSFSFWAMNQLDNCKSQSPRNVATLYDAGGLEVDSPRKMAKILHD